MKKPSETALLKTMYCSLIKLFFYILKKTDLELPLSIYFKEVHLLYQKNNHRYATIGAYLSTNCHVPISLKLSIGNVFFEQLKMNS
jgi:hypothetical protein